MDQRRLTLLGKAVRIATAVQTVYLLPLIYQEVGSLLVYRWELIADYPRLYQLIPDVLYLPWVFLWFFPLLLGQMFFLPEILFAAELLGFCLWLRGVRKQGAPLLKRQWLWLPPCWLLILYGLFLQMDFVRAAMSV